MSKQTFNPDEAYTKYVNEYTASFRAIKDEVEAKQPNAVKARKRSLEKINKKRDTLLTKNLEITAKQFDDTPILFALRPRFFEMMDEDFDTIDEWWEDPEGWLKHRQGYCADDIAVPFGSNKLKQPSCWSKEDVLQALVIDVAYKAVYNEIVVANKTNHSEYDDGDKIQLYRLSGLEPPMQPSTSDVKQVPKQNDNPTNAEKNAQLVSAKLDVGNHSDTFLNLQEFADELTKRLETVNCNGRYLKLGSSRDQLRNILATGKGTVTFKATTAASNCKGITDALNSRLGLPADTITFANSRKTERRRQLEKHMTPEELRKNHRKRSEYPDAVKSIIVFIRNAIIHTIDATML